ncbi:MAG: RidA family protein [Proteobacteria bacterium]|nr:RidA family protein [Pseudomonadota bacterium]
MATKLVVNNEKAPNLNNIFNWGLKVSDFSELFFIASHGALKPDFQVEHPGDPVGQTHFILSQLKEFLEENDYSMDDVVQIVLTISKDVTEQQFEAVAQVYAEYMNDILVKPSGGTMRVVERLAFPGMMVEFQFLAAK